MLIHAAPFHLPQKINKKNTRPEITIVLKMQRKQKKPMNPMISILSPPYHRTYTS